MAGQKFQYDESGGTFYYFVLSFLALLLLPSTYYLWPRKENKDEAEEEIICNCPGCKKKRRVMEESKPWKLFKDLIIKFLILSGWCFLAFLAYKVSQFEYEYANFDPYEILGVPLGSSETTIKRAYRRLSVILHPDKETGDEKAFMTLTKAYQALTDDEARRNWEKYGNPDGPGAMSFGIALPSWIVEKENSVWVLGLYALIFMVAMPTVVGMWWYKSIKYSSDKVLLDTTKMYYFFFHKTPSMPLKRVIMILGASLEFEKKFNSEIVERESDNYEVPKLFSQLHNLSEKNRERPLYYKYSLKARALIHAHLSRIPLNPETLDGDRLIIVKKCPVLIQEMINCISQLILLAYAQRVPRLLNIETLENCMKLCPMIVQALWECKSPLMQLPYVQEEHLKHFMLKKRCIRNVQQFVRLKQEDRRTVLKFLKDDQYEDVIRVVGRMPHIELNVRCEVIDDEATTVYTAGAIVTVTVTLRRKNLNEVFGDVSHATRSSTYNKENDDDKDVAANVEETDELLPKTDNKDEEENARISQSAVATNKTTSKPVWQRKPQKGTKKGHKKQQTKKSQTKSNSLQKKINWERKQREKMKTEENLKSESKDESKSKKEDDAHASDDNEKVTNDADGENDNAENRDTDDSDNENSSENDESTKADDDTSDDEKNKKKNDALQCSNNEDEDDDDDWDKFRSGMSRKDRVLEGRRKISHSVHCPYFPDDKQEYWWIYISDRKSRTLLTSPYHVTELVDYDEIQLKFTAPKWPGLYTFTVCLRSDSYLGFDQTMDIKLDVKEAPEIPTEHPQWDISDEEDEDKDEGSGEDISEFTTDEDVEED